MNLLEKQQAKQEKNQKKTKQNPEIKRKSERTYRKKTHCVQGHNDMNEVGLLQERMDDVEQCTIIVS